MQLTWKVFGSSAKNWASLVAQMLNRLPVSACNVGDLSLIPESGKSPGEGNGNPLQYACLENPMGGGAWWATIHGVAKSRTQVNDFTFFSLSFKKLKIKLPYDPAIPILGTHTLKN